MSMAITPPGGTGGFEPPPRVDSQSNGKVFNLETGPTIPAPVTTGINEAAQRYQDLKAQGRELHFRVGEAGGIVVDVCDLEGNVIRTVAPDTALDIIGGAPAE